MGTASKQDGTIAEWFDEKGYGWLESGGTRFFAHIKDFEVSQRRPRAGEKVMFIPGTDSKGCPRAERVKLARAGQASGAGWGAVALLIFLPLLAITRLPLPWWMGASGFLIISLVTYRLYAYDKKQASSGGWRVSEANLHLLELLGGWPGSIIAQSRVRHKTVKPSYQVTFWAIVLVYQIVAVDVLLDHRLSWESLVFLEMMMAATAQ